MAMLEYGDEFIVEDALSYLESGGMKEIVLRPKISVDELVGGAMNLTQSVELRKYYNMMFYDKEVDLIQQTSFKLVLQVLEKLRAFDNDNDDQSYEMMAAANIISLLFENDPLVSREEDDEDFASEEQFSGCNLSASQIGEQLMSEQDILDMLIAGGDDEIDLQKAKDTAMHYLETIWLPWLYGLAMDSKVSWISTFASSSTKLATMLIQKEESNSAFSLQVIKPIEVAQVKVFCCCDSAQFFCHALRSVSGVGKSINVWPCVKCGIFLHKVCHPTVVDVDGGIVNYCRNCMPVDPNNGNNVVLMEEEPSFLCV